MLATVLGIIAQETQLVSQFNALNAKATQSKKWGITNANSKAVFVDSNKGYVYKVYMTDSANKVLALMSIFDEAGVAFFNPVEILSQGEMLTVTKEVMITAFEIDDDDATDMKAETFHSLLPESEKDKIIDFLTAFNVAGTTPNNMGTDADGNIRCFDWNQGRADFAKIKALYEKYGIELPSTEKLLSIKLQS